MILIGFQLRQITTNKLPKNSDEKRVYSLRKCLKILEGSPSDIRKTWTLTPIYDDDIKDYTYVE